jgi:hypothetical protein
MRVWPTVLHMCLRIVLTTPLAPIIILLCVSMVGMPLGLGIGMAAGAWATAPLRRHPLFNTSIKDEDGSWL